VSHKLKKHDVVASAPGRANLIGEHIDYAGGVVLPFAISDRTYVGITRRNDRKLHVTSTHSKLPITIELDELEHWRGSSWARYPLGVVHILRTLGADFPGLDIEIDGSVPHGAGVSSSAALECATALALNELFSLGHSPLDLAKMCRRAENEYVGMPCGLMDQAASMLSQENHILAFDCLTFETQQLPFNLGEDNLEVLLIDSQVKHQLVDGGYASRFAACESARATLGLDSLRHLTRETFESADLEPLVRKRVSHVIAEMERVSKTMVALKEKNFPEVGELLNQSHASLRDTYEVSCKELDLACEDALTSGALGGRMMGGGFGGSAIILTPIDKTQTVIANVSKAFADAGFKKPRAFTVAPSTGARIEYSA
jgi:galactokinase